ncbi:MULTISPECIES: UDP-N-acetylmuramate:L-alanyl-gamma-D-glutamyl-meso-diaminopimelate ligase [Pseudoxanthomonas]|jgi:UDP-N-acetylmuramate: L-alanyl-gamma-D-glutamyl-meso-diaminopimelate ligase|uniref:UDP-N-acetylmuramate--L-alanyl-gamma-D-glutamyl-meso-2,6-diaminoheptandioate ligase n=1 Tax=Pseudoxanthomonas winnipegensis TaxID=2480810 RepID=A0A4V2HDF7_9GAMM|nr:MULTISPECIES: UDP-N-acetylmuramate:L-alanyl-gamma-D-glutamyl-meso-diaminopimelate ligase [Pseudoxanthomonas]TAA27002.1 UDP-N-acetylmuramate:L-alanyl-gamma-D-glutamyl-meso-diaminopimelate ligase [Pseudoxanthomonas winnipegensis]TMN23960.1 UDP-N-acetylmuramate:L-alanyl-gamma-D-glutamyl-meso-diaminopimelate ligase [Pseudoxanthomonas sp. X-1]UAY75649.1 UDP-N-acetylmuramate:L-alanyl-gamma-D-glutamyl-meso-diaminopimelate ligase [Pseudoxanthomonas sp. X-1]
MSKLHILGIAGTFMGGVAALARELGHTVEGSDQAIYPPMSTQLERLGIELAQGYRPGNISPDCDTVIVGNALSRGNAAVEAVLDSGRAYTSGAQWLSEAVLPGRTTLAVAGTHGKTTTTTILAYLLEAAGRAPGFLIGGVAEDFGVSARLGRVAAEPSSDAARHLLPAGAGDDAPAADRPLFVVEADEYDTAFFDKRSKFVHYRPRVAILNNLEYDHADIFPDVAAIQRQFHHLVRTVPGHGRLIVNGADARLEEVLAMGCWTPVERFGFDAALDWSARLIQADGSAFAVLRRGVEVGQVHWPLVGRHNVLNALAALAAAAAVGVDIAGVMPALADFRGVKRRLEVIGNARGVTVYDDFAHHPTAIATTLEGLRAKVGQARIVVAMEPRSNSMRLGAHADALAPSLEGADAVVFLHRPELAWDAGKVIASVRGQAQAVPDSDALVAALRALAREGDHVVFMSNGGFDGAPRRFLASLQQA